MEKRLRSSLQSSAEEFLVSATKLGFKSAKPSLKTLIHSLNPSSDLASSLPLSLCQSISQSITRFRQLSDPTTAIDATKSPGSPPTKRLRRSSRQKKTESDSNSQNSEAKREKARQGIVENLQVCAYVALLCVSHPKRAFPSSDLLPAVRELHDNLIIFESESILLSEIANLCEEWWKEQLPGREALISQSLPFLLSRSLTLKKKVDVHRVYALREAFTLFDFEDDSIEDLKLLLIRCVISPLYLKTEDGRRFVAFMFQLSGHLVKEALAMVKSQIPFGRKSMLEAYAEIIFRAWRVAEGKYKDEIEDGFLQGLIEGAIHASSGSLAASIRRILGSFISQRTTEGVERLLFRLAEPVIFRSLQVANSNVRQNSLHLLLDLFPLEDPDSTKEVKDALLEKQFFLLERLLMDDCPDVRLIAVEGSCRILHLFWEIIPSSTITKIITKIFDDMTHDASNEVRISTVNGIMYLLGNPQSHEILKVLLPRLGHLVLDSVPSIRAAVVDLLLLIRDFRTFQFHKVVHLDVLLSTLADDQPLVARKITKLLIPSYFPSKVNLEEACNRCVTLVKRSPVAGARFCEFALSEGASPQSLVELFKAFISYGLLANKPGADHAGCLIVAAASLCKSLESDAPSVAALKEELTDEKLKRLFNAAGTRCAQSSACDIISTISPVAVDSLFEKCMDLVSDCVGLSDNTERQQEIRSAHKMILCCGWFDDMFEALTKLLHRAVFGCHKKFGTKLPENDVFSMKGRKVKSSLKTSGKRRHVTRKMSRTAGANTFDEDYAIAIGISWQIKELLLSQDMRKAMLHSGILEMAFYALKIISEVSIVQCMQLDYMHTCPVLAYTALSLHMSFEDISPSGIKNKKNLECAQSSSEQTLLDHTMNHLLDCTNKLFVVGDCGQSYVLPTESRHTHKTTHHSRKKHAEARADALCSGLISMKQKRIPNMLKMLTAVFKFIVDAASMELVSPNHERCLNFTWEYQQLVISSLKQHLHDQSHFKEEDIREIFICLKSAMTYAAKQLSLVLKSSCKAPSFQTGAYTTLASGLLDLIASVEEHLGPGYASRLATALKPWLPDLIMALGCICLLKQPQGETDDSYCGKSIPTWALVLAKIELAELDNVASDEDNDRVSEQNKFPAFRKLMGSMVQLTKGNFDVLDAIGMVFLTVSLVGLEMDDFGLFMGLLRFVCVKLVGDEERDWEKLHLMLGFVKEIYPRLERGAEELSGDDRSQRLSSARALLEPIWMYYYVDGNGTDPMEEE